MHITNVTSDGDQQQSISQPNKTMKMLHKSTSRASIATERTFEDEPRHQDERRVEENENYRNWNALGFLLFLVGCIVGALVIVFHKPSPGGEPNVQSAASAPTPTNDYLPVYDPPTTEDCAAIAREEALPGQYNMMLKLLDVDLDISVESQLDKLEIAKLLPSLETTLRDRLVPALSNCPYSGQDPTRKLLRVSTRDFYGAENPKKYAIANTYLELQNRPGVSCSAQSPQPCHRMVLSLQLFLKGPEDDSTLMNLIYELGEERPLVETLRLEAPYTAMNFVGIRPGTPIELTQWPTMAPTKPKIAYNRPSKKDCQDIAQGLILEGQDNMLVELLDVDVDVTLSNYTTNDVKEMSIFLPHLEEAMKRRLVPALSHCPFNNGESLELVADPSYVVANTFFQLQDLPDAPCSEDSLKPCHRILLKLELFLKGPESISNLMGLVMDLPNQRPIVETLGLEVPFTAIDFVAIRPGTPTDTNSTKDSGST